MIKRVTLVRKADGLTMDQFASHWLGAHVELVRKLQGIRGYRVNLLVERPTGVTWDGIGEAYFDSLEAAHEAFSKEPISKQLKQDVPSFISETQTFFVEEHWAVPLE